MLSGRVDLAALFECPVNLFLQVWYASINGLSFFFFFFVFISRYISHSFSLSLLTWVTFHVSLLE